jgi:Domain of unknown function (DUF4337)
MPEIDPMDLVDADEDESAEREERAERDAKTERENHGRLNTRVAITVALLATFTGVCKVKDDNIVQAMQQAQSDRVDHWSYYQAKNVREEVARAASDELRAQGHAVDAARYDSIATNEARKKEGIRRQAEDDQRAYDALNYRDDQFDLSDALAAIAISMLAVAALTKKPWMYLAALVPTALAVLMGLAGLVGWHLHPDTIARLLS